MQDVLRMYTSIIILLIFTVYKPFFTCKALSISEALGSVKPGTE